MIRKFGFVVFVIFVGFQVNAQLILGGDFSVQAPFGGKRIFYGPQLLVEKPMNEKSSLFGKIGYYLPQNVQVDNVMTVDPKVWSPETPSLNLSSRTQFSTIAINFGRRSYWINPIDYGFSVYGETTINFSFNMIKSRLQSYDTTKYIMSDPSASTASYNGKGSVFNLGFGGNIGVKYNFVRFGILYFDLGIEYDILRLATNEVASQNYNSFGSPLYFYFGLGYKKILYFGSTNR